ncbi:MAG TPA: dockerin type I domain-containing protein [Roseateles sp.]
MARAVHCLARHRNLATVWQVALLLLFSGWARADFVRNGDFERSDFDGWTLSTASTPPASSLVPLGFVSMDVGGRGFSSVAPVFVAGRGGGGLAQTVQLYPGKLAVSVDVASNYESTGCCNDAGGLFTLYLNGVAMATHDFGFIFAGETKRARLAFATTLSTPGSYELKVGISRPGAAAGGPTLFIDNVTLTGPAAVRAQVLPAAHLYVADAAGAVLRVHPRTGAQKVIASGGLVGAGSPYGIAVAGGLAYVATNSNSTLAQVDLESGAQAAAWVGRPLFCPQQLAWEANGTLLASNACSTRISRFDPRMLTLTGLVTPSGLFIDPFGMAVLPSSQVLVADGVTRSVVRIDANGGNPATISTGGAFRRPQAMTLDATGKVWVADTDSNSIVNVDPATGRQNVYPLSTRTGIAGIAVVGAEAYVSAPHDRQILAYQLAKRTQRVLVQGGLLSGPLQAPTQLTVAPDVVFTNFSDLSSWSLNGKARQNGTLLRLTDDGIGQSGSAFHVKPFLVDADSRFSTRFAFRVTGVNGGGLQGSDGLAFVIHADPRGPAALGNAGEGLGFGTNDTSGSTATPIAPSLAIEFDTHQNAAFDPDGNHVALVQDGQVSRHLALASLPCPGPAVGSLGCWNSGEAIYVWIDYGVAVAQRLEVFTSNRAVKPTVPLLVKDGLNLAALGDKLYFGFSAATGLGSNIHEILNWAIAAPTVAGDLDGDNTVTCSDLAIVKRALGTRSGNPGFDPMADTQGDGVIDVKDVAFVTQKLPSGTSCP